MRVITGTISLFIVTLSLLSCGRSDYIRNEQQGFLGFRFFLFASFGTKKVQANGDAVLIQGDRFAFRLYDNLLNQYVMYYSSRIDGLQKLVFPMNQIIYRQYDAALSEIMVNKMYAVMTGELINSRKDDTIKKIELENNEIKAIMFQYGEWELMLQVLKRMEDGKPSRLKIVNGENSLIFDIIEYHPYSFNVEMEGYKTYTLRSQKTFLSWIGEAYGGQ